MKITIHRDPAPSSERHRARACYHGAATVHRDQDHQVTVRVIAEDDSVWLHLTYQMRMGSEDQPLTARETTCLPIITGLDSFEAAKNAAATLPDLSGREVTVLEGMLDIRQVLPFAVTLEPKN